VYVSLGETDEGELQRKVDSLEQCDGMEHTLVIHASAHEPALHRYLAPFIAATIVDHWRQQGQHSLVVMDDMQAHAEATMELEQQLADVQGGHLVSEAGIELGSTFGKLLDRPSWPEPEAGLGSHTWLCLSELDLGKVLVRRKERDGSLELQRRKNGSSRATIKHSHDLQKQVFRALNGSVQDFIFLDRNSAATLPSERGTAAGSLGLELERSRWPGDVEPNEWKGFSSTYDNYPPFLPFLELLGSTASSDRPHTVFPPLFQDGPQTVRATLLECREVIETHMASLRRSDATEYLQRLGKGPLRIRMEGTQKRDLNINLQHLELLVRSRSRLFAGDEQGRRLIKRSQILCRLLHQTPQMPLSMVEQVVLVFACTEGHLDFCPPLDVSIDAALFAILHVLRGGHPGGWWAGTQNLSEFKAAVRTRGTSKPFPDANSSAEEFEGLQNIVSRIQQLLLSPEVQSPTESKVGASSTAYDPRKVFLGELLPALARLSLKGMDPLLEHFQHGASSKVTSADGRQ
jgi:hypothetical protein